MAKEKLIEDIVEVVEKAPEATELLGVGEVPEAVEVPEATELLGVGEVPEAPEEITKVEKKKQHEQKPWKPKTSLGKQVQDGEISDINHILESGQPILEAEITDTLLPDLEVDLLLVGQSKGKFGGGKRRAFRSTQKKTKEGNKPKFNTYAIVGNHNGILGLGYGKAKETVPAREKATRNAKLNLIKVRRAGWQRHSKKIHTLPFVIEGKCGSVIVRLMPAPIGTGLACNGEIRKMLRFAGLKDVWSQTFGHTASRANLIEATFKALKKTTTTKVLPEHEASLKRMEEAQ